MRAFKFLPAAVLAAAFCAGLGQAKTLREDQGPAELPPDSYTARQYVDSKGCVYVRAGYGGEVKWVPRVSRGRDVLCGFKPTFADAVTAAPSPKVAAAPTSAPGPEVRAKPAPARVAAAPVVKAPRPAASAARPPASKVSAAPEADKPTVQEELARLTRRTGDPCPGGVVVSARRVQTERGPAIAVRCSAGTNRGTARTPVPKKASPVAAKEPAKPPKGYRLAWEDGRLNPDRAKGTAAGEAAMNRVWTRTVPRHLIKTTAATRAAPQATLSTKSSLARTPRFVQVAAFAKSGNERSAVVRLQGMGLPVSTGSMRTHGRVLKVIYAGPFRDPGDLNSALAAVRKAGYRDAILR